MRNMPSNKASEPDGVLAEFYKRFWEMISVDVCATFHHFNKSSKLPDGWKSTFIVLIPK